MPKLRHIAIAAKDPDAMAEFYKKAFDFKEVRKSDGPLAYGYHLSDGTIDLAILRFKTDQIGKGLDYTGLHHFGILVEDVDKAAAKLESLGGKHYMDQATPSGSAASRSSFTAPKASCSMSPNIPGPALNRCRPNPPKPPNSPTLAKSRTGAPPFEGAGRGGACGVCPALLAGAAGQSAVAA